MPSRVFVDTETTGVGNDAELIEIGYVADSGFEYAIRLPYEPGRVAEGAHRVNDLGCGGREPFGVRMDYAQAARHIQSSWRGCELYFNNPGYDVWLLRNLQILGGVVEPSWRYHPWDVAALLKGAARLPASASLDMVKNILKVDWAHEPEVHGALDGARLVKRMFDVYEDLVLHPGR